MNEPMTGRDLILYILQNQLEDAPVFEDGRFLNFITVSEAAVRFGVGEATVKAWIQQGYLSHISFGEVIYIRPNDLLLWESNMKAKLKIQ